MPPPRRSAALLGLIGLVLLAGCAQLTVHSTVEADGSIAEYRVEVNTSRMVYGFLEQSAEREGYDSVRESFMADMNTSEVGEVTYDEEFDGDRVTMTITATEFEPPEGGPIEISEDDEGRLVYEDRSFANATGGTEMDEASAAMASGLAVDYYLTMPGEIVETNADEVDGNTAEWHATGADAFTDTRVYAVSEPSTATPLDGFGAAVGVIALVVVVLVGLRRAGPRRARGESPGP